MWFRKKRSRGRGQGGQGGEHDPRTELINCENGSDCGRTSRDDQGTGITHLNRMVKVRSGSSDEGPIINYEGGWLRNGRGGGGAIEAILKGRKKITSKGCVGGGAKGFNLS